MASLDKNCSSLEIEQGDGSIEEIDLSNNGAPLTDVEIENGDGNTNTGNGAQIVSLSSNQIVFPEIPSFDIRVHSIPVAIMAYIFAVLKYFIICCVIRVKGGVEYSLIALENAIGNSRTLDYLFGFEELQRIIDESPAKQKALKESMESVAMEQQQVQNQCDDLEKRLKRLAERQKKFEEFLLKQAANKKAEKSDQNLNNEMI